jgi:predicted TIM-barrel fold metal-dependent hydrolase
MPIVECIVDFFGSDRVLFGTDTPFDTNDGSHSIPVTISAAEGAVHDDAAGAAIFEGNSRRILGIDA